MANFPDLKSPKLDQAADMLTWLSGATELCKVLQIEKFTRLGPLPAHRFLAYLAREGLVTEIISTNYDTCIEKTFRNSFSGQEDADARAGEALAVIWSLAHYRTQAGRSRSKKKGDPVLHLYKINGDADDYDKALTAYDVDLDPERLDERASRIILTERQLQTFRDELWARDLFADRARSRSLLFCGFGSEEPQVRHYAMLLMEEMQRQSRPVRDWADIAELPNAPFLAIHDGSPSFAQLQIMVGFVTAHVQNTIPPRGEPALEAAFSNVFFGSFGGFLENAPMTERGKLPADLFFTKLFQATWLRRVDQELTPGYALHTWLRSIVRTHGAWVGWLREAIGADAMSFDSDDKRQTYRSLFGTTDELFKIDPENQNGPILIMGWLYAAYTGGEQLGHGLDFYLSLREEPLFTLATLLLITWLQSNDGRVPERPWDKVKITAGLGLRLSLPPRQGEQDERTIYLLREGMRASPSRFPEPAKGSIWIIMVPGNTLPSKGNETVVTGSPFTPSKIVYRSTAAVLRNAETPRKTPRDVLDFVFTSPVGEDP